MASRGTIIVAGSLAQRRGHGGHAWVFLQYLLGFRQLGWDVLFLDRLAPQMCTGAAGNACAAADSAQFAYLRHVMEWAGLGDCFAVLGDTPSGTLGASARQVRERVRGSALLINVMGYLRRDPLLEQAPRRVFLDIDPGFPQMWRELGLADPMAGHDDFVTIGLNIGRDRCEIPTCGVKWVTTAQPVVLDRWPVRPPCPGGPVTSVCTWRGDWGSVEYRGKVYGLRVHEFRNFIDLPRLAGRRFELALDIHPAEAKDVALLDEGGWTRVDPASAAGDPAAYQDYIARSSAEFMVAKNLYVQTRGGWFSDRSICYLATGRPVVAQDTGFRGHFPTGEGLLSFTTLEEAADAVASVFSDYDRHAAAARRIAQEHFNSDKVLTRLLNHLGVH